MYAEGNPKTKKALKERVMTFGKIVTVYQPNDMGFGGPKFDTDGPTKDTAKVTLEGPHYPAPHTWYATCRINREFQILPGTVK